MYLLSENIIFKNIKVTKFTDESLYILKGVKLIYKQKMLHHLKLIVPLIIWYFLKIQKVKQIHFQNITLCNDFFIL